MGKYDFSLDLNSVNTMSIINSWIANGSRILEFGPANGRLTRYLKEEKHCRMTIVEIDNETGKQAALFAEKAYLGTEGDIEKFRWTAENEPYDYIIFADVLEHLHCPDRVLKEAAGLLKEEGEILVSIPNITHNSVMIELFNDRFDYRPTGLLDSTHIHFFSLGSFRKMCKDNGVEIMEIRPVYSRVGNNEIDNSWQNVPSAVEREFRKRPNGSVYQFVLRIKNASSKDTKKEYIAKTLPEESRTPLEMQAYYKVGGRYSDDNSVSTIYYDGDEGEILLDISKIGQFSEVCLRPMRSNGWIEITAAEIIEGEERICLRPSHSNASTTYQRWFMFRNNEPHIYFPIPRPIVKGHIRIAVRALEHRMDSRTMDQVSALMREKKEAEYVLEKRLDESIKYNEKLEDELTQVKEASIKRIKQLEETEITDAERLKEAREYSTRLECQLQEAKEYAARLDGQLQEAKEYVQHLEKDITDLKGTINSFLEKK